MSIREIDPLRDPSWSDLVASHPAASVFHTVGWLQALKHTYGYEPAVLTTSGATGTLTNGLVFCRVHSWVTGRRLVSLPFSDHCQPLVEKEGSLADLLANLQQQTTANRHRYVELRPASPLSQTPCYFGKSASFYLHRLDLRSGVDEVFRRFHRDCIQRKIRRAERERLSIEANRSPETLKKFYDMVVRTRRRQGLPPQPITWFHNLMDCLGSSVTIRLACKNGRPVAGILTLQHGKRLVYKYGASDERFHALGGMACVFWHAIQEAISNGLDEMDLGRSDIGNPGLIAFKEHLGANGSALTYWRYPTSAASDSDPSWIRRGAQQSFSYVPDFCLPAIGSFLYRHMG